jgi:hypothetical protein
MSAEIKPSFITTWGPEIGGVGFLATATATDYLLAPFWHGGGLSLLTDLPTDQKLYGVALTLGSTLVTHTLSVNQALHCARLRESHLVLPEKFRRSVSMMTNSLINKGIVTALYYIDTLDGDAMSKKIISERNKQAV